MGKVKESSELCEICQQRYWIKDLRIESLSFGQCYICERCLSDFTKCGRCQTTTPKIDITRYTDETKLCEDCAD